MNIKYLQDAPQGKVGEVVDLDPVYADALIAMGFAEVYKEEKPKAKPKTKTDTKQDKKDNS